MKKSAEVTKVTRSKTTLAAAVPKRTRAPRKATPLVVAAEKVSPESIPDWPAPTVEAIAIRAYEIFQTRAWDEGDAVSDWFQAERELKRQR